MIRRLACIVILMLSLCVLALPARAQGPEPPPDPPMTGQAPPPPEGTGPNGPGGPMGPGGPPMGPHGPAGPQGPARRVTPDMEAKYLAFLKQVDAASADELMKLKTQNPAMYQRAVSEGTLRMQMAEMLQKKDPAAYQDMIAEMKLDGSVRRTAEKYKDAPAAQKAALKEQLRTQLTQLFDVREHNRKRQIDRLEKDLARMKATLETRARSKAAIVNRRVEEMISDPATSW